MAYKPSGIIIKANAALFIDTRTTLRLQAMYLVRSTGP